MKPIPLQCTLDGPGLSAQAQRYAAAARSVQSIERSEASVVALLVPDADAALVDELVAVERECCPFFRIEWDRGAGRLAFATAPEHAAALDAIAHALSAH